MPTTNFGSAIKTGTGLGDGADAGFSVLSQSVTIDFVAESGGGNDNVDAYLDLPPGSQIHSINLDTTTAWDSVTSAGVTVGSTAGGTQYASSSDVKSAGREAPTLSGAQLLAMSDIGNNTRVHFRVAQSGNTTAGKLIATLIYSQKR